MRLSSGRAGLHAGFKLHHGHSVTVLQGADYCAVTTTAGQAATVSAKAAAASAIAPSCLIRVSFEGAFAGSTALAATATVNVVFMKTLVLRPQGYDVTRAQGTLAIVADAAATNTVLQPIACSTSDYEQVAVECIAQPCVLLLAY